MKCYNCYCYQEAILFLIPFAVSCHIWTWRHQKTPLQNHNEVEKMWKGQEKFPCEAHHMQVQMIQHILYWNRCTWKEKDEISELPDSPCSKETAFSPPLAPSSCCWCSPSLMLGPLSSYFNKKCVTLVQQLAIAYKLYVEIGWTKLRIICIEQPWQWPAKQYELWSMQEPKWKQTRFYHCAHDKQEFCSSSVQNKCPDQDCHVYHLQLLQ